MKAVVLSWEGEAGEGRQHNCVFNGQECIALASTHRIFFFLNLKYINRRPPGFWKGTGWTIARTGHGAGFKCTGNDKRSFKCSRCEKSITRSPPLFLLASNDESRDRYNTPWLTKRIYDTKLRTSQHVQKRGREMREQWWKGGFGQEPRDLSLGSTIVFPARYQTLASLTTLEPSALFLCRIVVGCWRDMMRKV